MTAASSLSRCAFCLARRSSGVSSAVSSAGAGANLGRPTVSTVSLRLSVMGRDFCVPVSISMFWTVAPYFLPILLAAVGSMRS